MKRMQNEVIEKIEMETRERVTKLVRDDLKKIILFGSYARGDYTEESDIDIAVLVDCNREETAKYKDGLVVLSADLDLKNMVVVNFICLPYHEFNQRKAYYPFYSNIEAEGKVLYG